ncbi:hypothetical protein EP47_11695 [Legionella norrlandica]|uniref:Uncharacterized protein n=1 Tax=Legionella norrlandica TaxID=1498499 RepID=A0A0A2TAK6_9GAMM|nr:hypothetical protein [Legionella norrlandica]KGP64423.1 hypothetical protein EP47_11695 [Legionella norrlandica]
MRKLVLVYILFFFYSISYGARYPQVRFVFPVSPVPTVFYGDTMRIPVQMHWWASARNPISRSTWNIPIGSRIEYVSGSCYELMTYVAFNTYYTCYLNIVIPGDIVGKTISGVLSYDTGVCKHSPNKNCVFSSPLFSVRVIPHPLSMSTIPIQQATANLDFVYNLKNSIRYFDENIAAGKAIIGIVSPMEQDGVHFEQSKLAFVGKPNRVGPYYFKASVQNEYSKAQPTDFIIHVKANPKDKPIFKKHYSITSAKRNQKYTMNLLELIEPRKDFQLTNQIRFRIQSNYNNPDWLTISKDDATRLEGFVPGDISHSEVEVALIASSNTGGDSEPFVLKIPLARDSSKAPIIEDFELQGISGNQIREDLSRFIKDPLQDGNLKVILDEVMPKASWLKISAMNPTVLEGVVPDDASGQQYWLTLRASTAVGGSSEARRIPLQINLDKQKTPRFKASNPVLPLIYPGQSFSHDFVANKDVYPEYEDFPYEISFSKGGEGPSWLKIENNQLIAKQVPEQLNESMIEISIIIKNRPGGKSPPLKLSLMVMNELLFIR